MTINVSSTIRSAVFSMLAILSSTVLGADIKFDFRISWFEGPLSGTSSVGWFSYDSSIVVPGPLPGHPVVRPDVLSGFSMDVRGVLFGMSDVTSPLAFFGPNGELTGIQLGTACTVVESPPGFFWGSCAVLPWDSGSFVFNYSLGNLSGTASIGTNAQVGSGVLSRGTITVSAVPEVSNGKHLELPRERSTGYPRAPHGL